MATSTPAPGVQAAPVEGSRAALLDRRAWFVGALAVGVRLVWAAAFARVPDGLYDPFLYHVYGINIAKGIGYRSFVGDHTAYYPPGYPYFVGGVYRLGDALGLGDHPALLIGVAQSLLWGIAVMAVVVTARVVWRPGRDVPWWRDAGVLAGLVLALWPNLIVYASAWLSESLFVCLLSLALVGLSVSARAFAPEGSRPSAFSTRTGWWAVVGAAVPVALATMVRPQVLLGLPLVALAWLLGGLGWRRVLGLAAVVSVAVAALVIPWAVRNEGLFGHFVPISTNDGDNLCVGFHDHATGGFEIPEACQTGEFWPDGRAAEYRRSVETRRRAFEWIRSHPLELPWLSLRKLGVTYSRDDDGLEGSESYGRRTYLHGAVRATWQVADHIYYVAVMLAAVAGLVLTTLRAWRSRPRDGAALALVGMCLAGVAVPVLFFGDARFKAPVTPLFALFAALALVSAFDARSAGPAGSASTTDSARATDGGQELGT